MVGLGEREHERWLRGARRRGDRALRRYRERLRSRAARMLPSLAARRVLERVFGMWWRRVVVARTVQGWRRKEQQRGEKTALQAKAAAATRLQAEVRRRVAVERATAERARRAANAGTDGGSDAGTVCEANTLRLDVPPGLESYVRAVEEAKVTRRGLSARAPPFFPWVSNATVAAAVGVIRAELRALARTLAAPERPRRTGGRQRRVARLRGRHFRECYVGSVQAGRRFEERAAARGWLEDDEGGSDYFSAEEGW